MVPILGALVSQVCLNHEEHADYLESAELRVGLDPAGTEPRQLGQSRPKTDLWEEDNAWGPEIVPQTF